MKIIMGTNTNQIATRNDINAGKRQYAYNYSRIDVVENEAFKCPTKAEINQIEFLDVKNVSATTSENTYWNVGSANWNSYGSMKIGPNNTTVNSNNTTGIPITPSSYENYPLIITNTSPGYYVHSSTSQVFNISFNAGVDDLDFYEFDNVEANALCYKTISVTSGKYTNLKINYSAIAYANTKSAQSNYSFSNIIYPNNDGKEFRFIIALVDSNSEVIYLTDVEDFVGASSYANIYFTPKTSSISIYIIPRYIDVSFYPSVIGNLYVGIGFKLGVTKIIYDSYYDTNSKLVQYEDIGKDTARRFGVYYGVWNNKSTPARVDFAEVLIHTTPDTFTSGWTKIGGVTLSDIAGKGTRSGVIACTLPSNIDLGAQQYYLTIRAGDTLSSQNFYGGWGNAKEDVTYEYCREGTRGCTPPIQLMPTTDKYDINGESDHTPNTIYGVLNYLDVTGGLATVIKGAYNTNPELKGWIKIT